MLRVIQPEAHATVVKIYTHDILICTTSTLFFSPSFAPQVSLSRNDCRQPIGLFTSTITQTSLHFFENYWALHKK